MAEFWGYHLILDCKGCDKDKVTKKENIEELSRIITKAIDMIPFGEPLVYHFGHNNPKTSGFSLVQLIETSAITGHFVDHNGDTYLDIFSCKSFDIKVAKKTVEDFLKPQSIKEIYMTRQA